MIASLLQPEPDGPGVRGAPRHLSPELRVRNLSGVPLRVALQSEAPRLTPEQHQQQPAGSGANAAADGRVPRGAAAMPPIPTDLSWRLLPAAPSASAASADDAPAAAARAAAAEAGTSETLPLPGGCPWHALVLALPASRALVQATRLEARSSPQPLLTPPASLPHARRAAASAWRRCRCVTRGRTPSRCARLPPRRPTATPPAGAAAAAAPRSRRCTEA